MNPPPSSELVQFLKAFALRYAIAKFILTLLAAGTALITLAFVGGLALSVKGQLFGVDFSVSYDSGAQIALPLIVGGVLVSISVAIFLRSQSEPRSKRIQGLEEAYAARGNVESVREVFRETFGVNVHTGAELDFLLAQPSMRGAANSLCRARSHVRFAAPNGYVLNTPQQPYRLYKAASSFVYFLSVVSMLALVPLTTAALVDGSRTLILTFTGLIVVFFLVAWSSLSAYSATYHAIQLTKRDA